MFKDVVLDNGGLGLVMAMMGQNIKRISTGVYTGCSFNFSNAVNKSGWLDFLDFSEEEPEVPYCGVADSVEQFMDKFGQAINASEYGYAVGFTDVIKSEQPSDGGWRWHKWGEYIGNMSPQCEYLHDEPEIDMVVVFSVMRTKDKVKRL